MPPTRQMPGRSKRRYPHERAHYRTHTGADRIDRSPSLELGPVVERWAPVNGGALAMLAAASVVGRTLCDLHKAALLRVIFEAGLQFVQRHAQRRGNPRSDDEHATLPRVEHVYHVGLRAVGVLDPVVYLDE